MPKYTLYYFNVRGRAEASRWLFAQAGVPYEDVRLAGESWMKKKPDFPFGQMPVLEVTDDEGKTTQIAQSHAIERYLAREFCLDGKTSWDVARGDALGEHMQDVMMKLPWREQDPELKKKLMKEAIEGPIADGLKQMEKFVQDNGYFVGDSVTSADIGFAVATEFLTKDHPNALDGTPKLADLVKRVKALPKIAEWIAKRPESTI